MGIKIQDLPATVTPSRSHVLPAMKDGNTVRITVGQMLDLIIGAAPGALDTLQELADALGDDPNFATTMTNALAQKANLSTTEINGLTAKATPTDADVFRLADSAASFGYKKISWGNIKAQIARVRSGPTSLGSVSTDFSIPSTTSKIELILNAWKLSGTATPLIRIGTGGAPATSGYTSSSVAKSGSNTTSAATSTAGFMVNGGTATNLYTGNVILNLQDPATNTWVLTGTLQLDGTGSEFGVNGKVSLAGAINILRITTSNGTDTLTGSATVYTQ